GEPQLELTSRIHQPVAPVPISMRLHETKLKVSTRM
ncbi:hypothetical protein Tco_1092966, partial [Tanacetum coccineum]